MHPRATARRAARSSFCDRREAPRWSWGPSPRRDLPAPPATHGTRATFRRMSLLPPTSPGSLLRKLAPASAWPAQSCSQKRSPREPRRLGPPLPILRPFSRKIQRTVDERDAFLGGVVGQEYSNLAIHRVASGAGVLAGNTYALLTLLQETGLVHEEHPALLVGEVLHYVLAQVVAYEVGIPLRRVQKALNAERLILADGFRELPAVFTLRPSEQPEQVAPSPVSSLRANEAACYAPVQFLQHLRPSADGVRLLGDSFMRDHPSPFLASSEG